MNLSRPQWKELLRKINKGGIQEFKEFISDVQSEAYNDALQNAMASVKVAILDSVEKTLHDEFGFGPKRISQFSDAFTKLLQETTIKKENEMIAEHPEKSDDFTSLSGADKTSFMIFLCVRHFVETMYSSNSPLFTDKDVKYHLNNAVAMMDYAEQTIASKVKTEELKGAYEEVVKRRLFLSGSEE